MHYHFHANIFARPYRCTWEKAATALERLPRMIFEPDGSFVVSGGTGSDRWQVDGHLFDFDGRLHRVELHGNCPSEALDALLRCIGWPEVSLEFEMVREGVVLDEAEFRRAVSLRAGSSPTPNPPTPIPIITIPTSIMLPPALNHTTWHITFGTYGTRLHGDIRPTVDKQHNHLSEAFIAPDQVREQVARDRMKYSAVVLNLAQREFIERQLPEICERGSWQYRTCAAAPDHVHLLCDIPAEIHGEKVRRLIKRWLTQSLNQQWTLSQGARWWAEEGSNKAIHDDAYRKNAFEYVEKQRALR